MKKMKTISRPVTSRILLVAALATLLTGAWSQAQEPWAQGAIRPSIGGEGAVNRMRPLSEIPYNWMVGPARFRLIGQVSAEFNDNVNLAETGRESDVIIEPRILVDGVWQATKVNELRLTMGLGFKQYLNNNVENTSSVTIDPGSRLSFDIFVNDNIRINLHDAFFISTDPTERATLSNVADYGRFENTAGFDVTWDMNKVILNAGYDHFTYVSLTGDFDYLDRNAEMFHASGSYAVTDHTTAGLDVRTSYDYYSQDFQNDSTFISVGPFVETELTRFIKLRAAGGFQGGYFDRGGGNDDSSNLNGWFANLAVAHRLNSHCTETLSAGHESQLGLRTNYEQVDYARYALNLDVIRNVPINFYGFYEHVEDSDGTDPENLNRFGTGIHFGYQLSKKASLGLDYQFLLKDSNLASLSYTQDRVFLTFDYRF